MDAPKTKRGPGRPKKSEVETTFQPDPEVVSPATVEGSQPGILIEDYLNQNYFSQGYVLHDVYPLEIVQSIEGKAFGNTLLYVLVKYAQ
jgi:hypothetical protein